jgi:hypothetical protein
MKEALRYLQNPYRNIEKSPLTFILSPNGGEGRVRGGLARVAYLAVLKAIGRGNS